MAKQTFTSGQVLTAAQMTSLQQTAMLGGDTTAKTTSYVLTAADAGTVVAMNSSGSTTITANTSIFSAGDIVTIQNRGTGTCTVTAGTATVNTSGSLVLAQYQGGVLYFNSASAAVFYQFATPASGDIEGVTAGTGLSGGGTSGTVTLTNDMATTITAAGDIVVGTGSGTYDNLPIGTTGQVLTADTTVSPYKVKWASAASSGALTKIASASFTNQASVTVDSVFSTTYKRYKMLLRCSCLTVNADMHLQLRYSTTTQSSLYYGSGFRYDRNNALTTYGYSNQAAWVLLDEGLGQNTFELLFDYVGNTSESATMSGRGFADYQQSTTQFAGIIDSAQTMTGFVIKASTGNVTGTYQIYGYEN